MALMLSPQFPELFKKENYAVNLALIEERQLGNVMDTVLTTIEIDGIWDKEYQLVPFGEVEGRNEAEPLTEKSMEMGYTKYGAIGSEAQLKIGLSDILKSRARDFAASGGGVDEPKFAGYLADTFGRAAIIRRDQKWRKLAVKTFNYGGIQAGNAFFNAQTRSGNIIGADANTNLLYDGSPLFARPAVAHTLFATGLTSGTGAEKVSNYIDYSCLVANDGSCFNAFDLPPSYWALKLVFKHFVMNMQFDENGEREECYPDTLLVSGYNADTWIEILKSHFVEPTAAGDTTNVENIFQMEGYKVRLVVCVDLVKNTWFLGKSKTKGIVTLKPKSPDDYWAYWRNEENRTYWMSFEDLWGLMLYNWRYWIAGAHTTDGSTAPTFGDAAESSWKTRPASL